MPAEAHIPVKTAKRKEPDHHHEGCREVQRLLSRHGFDRAEQCAAGALHRTRHEKTHRRSGEETWLPAPNAMARFLRSKRSHSVGVMFFDITDPFCTPVLRGIENALYQSSYVQIFADAHNQRNRFERYLEMLLEHHVEALIVVANWLFVDIQLLADLSKRNITAATIGWEMPGNAVSSVMVDNEAGGRLALEHLHQLGHHKIAFIRGPKMLIDSAPRWKGIQKFAHSAGLDIDPALVLQLPDSFDPNSGFEGGYRFTEELLQRKKRFTALMAFDDLTALGAIRALTKAGVKVPENCSVVGFRRRAAVLAVGAVFDNGEAAAGSDGKPGREYRDGRRQRRAGKARLEHFAAQDEPGAGDPRFHASGSAQRLGRLRITFPHKSSKSIRRGSTA